MHDHRQKNLIGKLLGATAMIALATGLGACSIIPDWADPTTWFGDDAPPNADADGATPDLANLPAKPDASATDQQKVSDSLAADRSHAKYSADTLRGGTEAAATPPPEQPAGTSSQMVTEAAPSNAKASKAAATPVPSTPDQTAVRTTDDSRFANPTGTAMAGTLPDVAPAPAPAASSNRSSNAVVQTSELEPPAARPASSNPAVQTAELPVGTLPVLPPEVADKPAATSARVEPQGAPASAQTPPPPVASINPSDAALGFQPSSAPPLDPSISDFVAPQIVQNYRKSAAQARGVALNRPAAKAKPRKTARASASDRINLRDPSQSSANGPADAQTAHATAVVYFPGDIVTLNAKATADVRKIASRFKAQGENGFVRVVGHSSSRTPDMPVEKHLEIVFNKSQDRANAVSEALIRAGVPAKKILVEAVGDSQSIYYESMPKGEDGNRRVEIFLQS